MLASWLSALIVGVALLTVAGIAALAGKNRLSKATPPVPQEAVHGLKAGLLTPAARRTPELSILLPARTGHDSSIT